MTKTFFLVFLGGGLGSVLRLATYRAARLWLPPDFPWGTLAVNVLGSLLAGWIAAVLVGKGLSGDSSPWLFLIAGLLGGFTTFSAFSLDTLLMWQRAPGAAVAYVGATLALSFAAAAAAFFTLRPSA